MTQSSPSGIEKISDTLRRHRQEHLLRFVEQLSEAQKAELLADIEQLDFALIDRLIDGYVRKAPKIELPERILPAPYYPAVPSAETEDQYQQARRHGQELIAAGKVAAFTVAGGQGTRLNIDGPKGNVPATPLENKTLFQVFAEAIAATQQRYDCTIAWYIMTSPVNHDDTMAAFKRNDYFGLDRAQVTFFRQGMMPAFDTEGKILLAAPGRLALSPDGHGGSLRALYNSGALDDMANRGIEQISYFQIDNPLVTVLDPLFVGLHALNNAEMSSKAVIKCDPLERVGNFTLADDRVAVIEYSDLPDELAQKRQDDGRLLFELGSVAIHMISRDFVERLNRHGFSLPWHRAVKRVPYIDETGRRVNPEQPNGIKLETFVFDALPLAEKSIILEIDRAERFAPIKNATGTDSLESSQKLQIERAARWLESAGVEVPRKSDGAADVVVEISPLFALDAEELKEKRAQIPPLKSGDKIYLG